MASKKLKKLGKIAALAAAAYGASKLGRKRATDAPGNALAKAKRLMTSDAAYTGGGYDDHITRIKKLTPDTKKWTMPYDPHEDRWPNKGGGIATRGKGIAYKSGGRVKSMGAAKRGGGIAKR